MATRVYPRNLYMELQRRWTAPPLDHFPRIDLPEERVFDELVDVCYPSISAISSSRKFALKLTFRKAIVSGNAAPIQNGRTLSRP